MQPAREQQKADEKSVISFPFIGERVPPPLPPSHSVLPWHSDRDGKRSTSDGLVNTTESRMVQVQLKEAIRALFVPGASVIKQSALSLPVAPSADCYQEEEDEEEDKDHAYSSMVRRFSIPPILSSPPRSVTPRSFLLRSHHREEEEEEEGDCDYLGVKHRMWVTKGEFFEKPTSFLLSTICA
ncbi:hypothetical protein NQZ68_029233 [Dissostichus eleginoides]|nr:hypothetical protein NQZ68_029233 [Dissostichus eleginoides]